jgi:DHA2 family multidrug resistance protein
MTPEQAMFQVNRLIDQQAFTRAADDVFLISSLMFLLLIGVVWFTKRPVKHAMNSSK